jgi:protein TonB
VVVAFTVARDGTVTSAQVRRSSGYSFFDKAGLDMVRRASPLPAPPAYLASEALAIELPIRFWYD